MTEQEIFIKAMECQSLEERTHFLDEACSGDPQLRERVESLIRQSGQLGSFLEHPAVEGISSPEIESPSEVHVAATVEHDDSAPDESDETFGAETMISDTHDDGDEIPLGYLQPSDKPDSLGRSGHYEVLEVVGRGAFGTVLRAFDEKLQRVVAIKVLSPEMASTSPARKRFLREARSSAAVRHENVVAIYAVEDEPIPYLVMEYIPGKTLQQRLKEQGPLDFIDVLRLGKQIADGLAAAHAEGLIHRDIKPGNILLEGGMNDRVKITDFGLARTADDASMTQSGVIAGTPLYMAPEQAQGQKLDQRADLFSLGSVLYQMLSGRPPFRAPNTVAVLKRVVDDEPRPIQEIIPEVPDWLCNLIGHLHAKDREDRYSTAQEVSQLLQQSIDDLNASRQPQIPSPVEVRDGSQSTSNVSSSKKQQPRKSKAKDPNQPKKSVPAWAPILAVFVGASAFFLAPRISRWMQTPIPDLPETEVQAGLKFDGRDDWVQISGLDWQYPQFTIEAFVTSAPNSDNGTIAFLSSTDQDAKEWMSLFDGGPAEPGKRISGAAAKGKTLYENAYGPFAPGKRQHRALVFDGYKLHYYINGVWQGERQAEPREGLEWNMRELNIGCNGQQRQFFQGIIDQLQISRVARYEDNFTAPTQLESDERTLAFYKFDEGQGNVLKDSSGNGHDGKIVGATWVHPDVSNSPVATTKPSFALQFDGVDDHVAIDSDIMGKTSSFTVEAIVTFPGNYQNAYILSGSGKDFQFGLGEINGQRGFLVRRDHNLTPQAHATDRINNQSVHVAGVWDGSTASFFLNGQRVDQGVNKQALVPIGDRWGIGCLFDHDDQGTRFFQGKIHEIRISNYPRYDENFPPKTQFASDSRTLALYHFDEGQGNVLKDSSGNGHDGKIIGATWVKLGQVQSESPSDLQLVAAGEPVNLIALLDPARDFRDDRLKVEDGKLITPKFRKDLQPAGSVGLIPYTQIPDNYDIKLQLERVSEHYSGFNMGLLVDGNHVAVGMDSGFNTKVWGLDFLDGLPAHRPENETCNPGRRLEIGKNTDVTIEVRKNHIRAICNGETLVNWQGDPNRLSVFVGFKIKKSDGLFFVAQADFIVHKMELIPYEASSPQTQFDWSDVWPADAPAPAIAPFDADQAKAHQEAWAKYLDVPVEYENSIGMKFRLIPPGEFMMGSTPEEIEEALKVAGKDEDWRENINSEAPLHKVILTQPLYVGVTEVTQTQYEQIVGTNPSHFAATGKGKDKVANLETGNHPVEMVNWNDAADFCAKLSQQEQLKPFYFRSGETVTSLDGTGYRLPTEAEWEYFCRAGTTTRFWSGDEEKDLVSAGWFGHNSGSRTHAAGELKSNPFGLSDVHGNVWEWVQDSWNRTFYQKFEEDAAVDPTAPISRNSPHMIRSGYWLDVPAKCRSSTRYGTYGWLREHHIGFRVVLLVDAVKQSNWQQD